MKDPIVEQVRRVKQRLAAKFNYDIRAIGADARKRQWDWGGKVVSWDAKRGRFVTLRKPRIAGKKLAAHN